MDPKYSKNLDGIPVTDEMNNQYGAGSRTLKHDTFFGGTDFLVRTAAGGGGALLVQNTHYALENMNARLTTEAGQAVYTTWRVTDVNFQNLNLYVTYKTIGDFAEAADINELLNLHNSHTHDYSSVFAPLNHSHNDLYRTKAELSATTDGAAGADLIGATPINGISGQTIQAQMESVTELINTKASALNNMLGVWPHLQSKLKNTYVELSGSDPSYKFASVVYCQNYIYTNVAGRKICKINAQNFQIEAATTPATPTSGEFIDIACDGINIFCLHRLSSVIRVYKYDMNFTYIANSSGIPTDSGGTLEILDMAKMILTPDYVFVVGLNDVSQSGFNRVTKSDMSLWSNSVAFGVDEYGAGGATFDGTYLYFGHMTTPAKFTKWNLSGVKQGSTLTLTSGNDKCNGLIYVALPGQAPVLMAALNSTPSRVACINPVTMTQSGSSLAFATGENTCRGLTFDGLYVYAVCDTMPVKVLRLNTTPAKMGNTFTFPSGRDYCSSVTFDGLNLWVRCCNGNVRLAVRDTLANFI